MMDTLKARNTTYGWCVEDKDGGVWWPNEAASAEIEEAADPAARAIEMAQDSPMRGAWHA